MHLQRCEHELFQTKHLCHESEFVNHYTPNVFFFKTCYFGDIHCLMHKKSNLFVCIFIVNCQFFQIVRDGLYPMGNTCQQPVFLDICPWVFKISNDIFLKIMIDIQPSCICYYHKWWEKHFQKVCQVLQTKTTNIAVWPWMYDWPHWCVSSRTKRRSQSVTAINLADDALGLKNIAFLSFEQEFQVLFGWSVRIWRNIIFLQYM